MTKIHQEELVWIATTNVTLHQNLVISIQRDKPVMDEDSGWRLYTINDTQEFIDIPTNLENLRLRDIQALDPRFVELKDYPIGTHINVEYDPIHGTLLYDQNSETYI